jgi:hypothetical protein
MFFWAEKDFDALPTHKTAGCEGGDGGGFEVVVGSGLEGMLAAYRCIYPRYAWVWDVYKQSW